MPNYHHKNTDPELLPPKLKRILKNWFVLIGFIGSIASIIGLYLALNPSGLINQSNITSSITDADKEQTETVEEKKPTIENSTLKKEAERLTQQKYNPVSTSKQKGTTQAPLPKENKNLSKATVPVKSPAKTSKDELSANNQQTTFEAIDNPASETKIVKTGKVKFSYGDYTDSRDGKVYKTIKIGNQIWMAENLAYLPEVHPVNGGDNLGKIPGYYVYDYSGTNVQAAKATENYKTFGVLYNWAAAQNACPDGWHIPSREEWEELANFIASNTHEYRKISNKSWATIGRHLKSSKDWIAVSGYTHGDALDSFGLSLQPGGLRENNGRFSFQERKGFWWSSSSRGNTTMWGKELSLYDDYFIENKEWLSCGISVRCIKD